jgi:hypothetical protein
LVVPCRRILPPEFWTCDCLGMCVSAAPSSWWGCGLGRGWEDQQGFKGHVFIVGTQQ